LTAVKTYVAIVPAAGIGSRMNSPMAKQYLKIANKTVIEHTLDALLSHPKVSNVIVVIHPEDNAFASLSIANHPNVHAIIGGNERVDSVLNGLTYCKNLQAPQDEKDQWVLVHDAARPCITHSELDDLLATAGYFDGAILAMRVVDTIKQTVISIEENGESVEQYSSIQRTLDRAHLWQAHTPQFFPLDRLIDAIKTAQRNNIQITDEASAMEHIHANVKLIEGRSTNIKITRPSDLALAEFYLNNNNKQRGTQCSG
jgi:2-C-methyl-D-erythritol 4-phosphate cytidylyltransferase